MPSSPLGVYKTMLLFPCGLPEIEGGENQFSDSDI